MTPVRTPDTLGARLAQVAARLPNKLALVDDETEVDFRRLDAMATSIARRIVGAAGERPGAVCLLFANKNTAIQAIFGAARSAHTYVPLDASDPEERLRIIVEDSEPIALLTEGSLLERARSLAPPGCVLIDVLDLGPDGHACALPEVPADALAYLFYTSGSTGRPKGVSQTHRNLLFFVDAYVKALEIEEADRVSLLYSLSFSAANMDIFGAVLNGATLCPYELRREGIRNLGRWLDRQRITVLHAVPTVFRELANSLAPGRKLPHLRAIDLGGESVFGNDVELFRDHTLPRCILVNHLAATEASVVAQHVIGHGSVHEPGEMIPVGRCPDGLRVDIRREDGSPAQGSEVGELIVCSAHVSPGYWRRPELNAAAFDDDPANPGVRRYVSNDFGYLDDGGNLHFLGRRGSRIKLRGHSVDLTEIEAALLACPGVTKAAVLAVSGERQAEPERLVAYLVTVAEEERDPRLIRRHIAARIPGYMCPSGFVFLDALPLTASGKIDRNALALLQPQEADPSREIEAPHDEIERKVAQIFERLLSVAPIGRGDDFFMLGGDSLAAVELQSRLRGAFGASPSNFHDDATVTAIAAAIRRLGETLSTTPRSIPVLAPLWKQGSAPPLFLVHGRHGQAFVSPHFMRLLGNDQPVWAFQARGLDGLSEPHTTIEEMAADYVDELRKVRPHGPYFLGALCAGALIAAVMARSLHDAGEAVLPLLLLDPPGHAMQGGYLQMTEERFVNKMKARAEMGGIAAPTDDPGYMKAVVQTVTAFEHAIARHRPRPYDGPAYMLASRQRLAGADATYLKSIFAGNVERFEVATSHKQVLDPHNADFAAHLVRCLELIRGSADSSERNEAARLVQR